MICPHCSVVVRFNWTTTKIKIKSRRSAYEIDYALCENCGKLVVYLHYGDLGHLPVPTVDSDIDVAEWSEQIYPEQKTLVNGNGIPEEMLQDYEEARSVLGLSAQASAALSRRILQQILQEKFNIKAKSLFDEIDQFVSEANVPSFITDAVDAIRKIGNWAAHPGRNATTGEIIRVEFVEAEWLLEVIEALFDFSYIQPRKLEERQLALNEKIKEVKGKAASK